MKERENNKANLKVTCMENVCNRSRIAKTYAIYYAQMKKSNTGRRPDGGWHFTGFHP